MKYNNYDGWYKWNGLDSYTCQRCQEIVPSYKRMRHIGFHLGRDETLDEKAHCVEVPA